MTDNTASRSGLATRVLLIVSWLWVSVPFAIGVYQLVTKAAQLFG
ncbi:hypothetical protein ACL03H_09640 [Saccharopolyspora sp. MS10]